MKCKLTRTARGTRLAQLNRIRPWDLSRGTLGDADIIVGELPNMFYWGDVRDVNGDGASQAISDNHPNLVTPTLTRARESSFNSFNIRRACILRRTRIASHRNYSVSIYIHTHYGTDMLMSALI